MRAYCDAPFFSVNVTPTGFQACCFHNMPSIDCESAEAFFHSDYMRDFRQQVMDGKHPHKNCEVCHLCLKNISNYFGAMEMYNNPNHPEHEVAHESFMPESANLFLSNRCNLGCRTCSPVLSNTQAKLRKRSGIIATDHPVQRHSLKIIDELGKIESIKRLFVAGGEIMIDPIYAEALERLPRRDYEVIAITNGNDSSDRFIEALHQYDAYTLCFSIDGDSATSEYIRLLSDQKKVYESIRRYVDKYNPDHFGIIFTLSNISAWRMAELAEEMSRELDGYLDKAHLFFNSVIYPERFSVSNLPDDLKSKLRQKWLLDFHSIRDSIKAGRVKDSPLVCFLGRIISAGEALMCVRPFDDDCWQDFLEFNKKADDFLGLECPIEELRNL